jgi:hypothetical protein
MLQGVIGGIGERKHIKNDIRLCSNDQNWFGPVPIFFWWFEQWAFCLFYRKGQTRVL